MVSVSSSDGSRGDQGSASSTGSLPRKSLDELLSQQRAKEAEYADMPSLSSYRVDEMSAVTSTSYTSFASNSRAGDSRFGDDNASLPSLASYRMEDMSTCSSYVSGATANNHYSDHSGEAWSSFRSGNVSIDTENDEGKSRLGVGIIRVASAPIRRPHMARSNSTGSANGPFIRILPPPAKGVLKQEKPNAKSDSYSQRMTNNRRKIQHDTRQSTPNQKSPRDSRGAPVNNPPTSQYGQNQNFDTLGKTTAKGTADEADASKDINKPSDGKTPVERTRSIDLDLLTPSATNGSTAKLSGSMGSLNQVVSTDGSSSTLRLGDSLPRLPRRTNTLDTRCDLSADGSQLSDDSTRISSDDDVTRISDGDSVSIESDVESDISIDTDTERHSIHDELERKFITDEAVRTSTDLESEREKNSLSPLLMTHELNNTTLKNANKKETKNPDIVRIEDGEAVIHIPSSLNEATEQPSTEKSTERNEGPQEKREQTSNTGTLEDSHTNSRIPDVVSSKSKSSSQIGSGSGAMNESGVDSNSSADKLKSPHDSYTSSSDPLIDTTTADIEEKKPEGKKRGKLVRRISSSLKSIGRVPSFRNSFRMMGKQASKLRLQSKQKNDMPDAEEVDKALENNKV